MGMLNLLSTPLLNATQNIAASHQLYPGSLTWNCKQPSKKASARRLRHGQNPTYQTVLLMVSTSHSSETEQLCCHLTPKPLFLNLHDTALGPQPPPAQVADAIHGVFPPKPSYTADVLDVPSDPSIPQSAPILQSMEQTLCHPCKTALVLPCQSSCCPCCCPGLTSSRHPG
jgi:hypothetical protein